ncbi:MAG: hypothetical protein KatS3mg012_1849 [Gaiellaceae bacterium]|jgi:flagellar biosynthesis/type III secretory pathway M-ring protein FliF/YscJ|nr:MAG: hypothetical protein KatS3mg012_1849 [Gaiellaceae bacterium]
MADKPRVKAPKQRTHTTQSADRKRTAIVAIVAGLGLLAGVFAVLALTSLAGGGNDHAAQEEKARTALEAAGCTLQVADALEGRHSITDPDGVSDEWNTDPPTSGPHYAIAAIFGIYEEPLQIARVVHNLEHGGVFILYGPDVPESTVDELRAFYAENKTGTIMAPYEKLGDEFAFGAWVVHDEGGNGYLAKCKAFDQEAADAFLDAFRFRGPERFDPSQLQPGL